MVVLSGVPEHSKAVRTFRGAGTGRVVRVLRDLELV